jgi:DcmR-like sensory protein
MSQASLCGQVLNGLPHICAFVDSCDQQYDILLPFLRQGLECNDRLLNLVSPEHHADHLMRLGAAGIDVAGLVTAGRLVLHCFEDTYLKDGCFSADRMLSLLEDAFASARSDGYDQLRGFGEMDWALSGLPGTEKLVEYEARVNHLAAKFNDVLVCVYDVNKFTGRVLADILSTHPKVILGATIYENPYYLPPEVFLKYLQTRQRLHARATLARSPANRGLTPIS